MKKNLSESKLLNTRMTRVSSLLTVGLAILGPGMKLPKVWAATVTSVASQGNVAWSDAVDWSAAGSDYQVLSPSFNLNLPVTAGLSLTASTPTGSMERRTQGSSWMGCFNGGESLLWKHELTSGGGTTEPITVSFSSPVLAVGTAIQKDTYGQYSGWIEAFDINNQLIGTYSAGANACSSSGGTASFVGIQADLPVISYVRLGVNATDSFAIGQLNILANGGRSSPRVSQFGDPTPVPEAAPVAAAGVFSLLLVRWVFFRKSENAPV